MIIILSCLYILAVFLMLRGGFTDPGIIPRMKDFTDWSPKNVSVKRVVNGHILIYTFCYTCMVWRPPRTSHCAVCDNCTERFDHHCLWLGICIGKRNYKFFYTYLFTLNITALLEIGYSIYLIVSSVKDDEGKKENFRLLIIICNSIVIFIDLMFEVFFLGKLFILHTYLLFKNATFYEYFKKKFPFTNPFTKTLFQHIYRVIFKFNPDPNLNLDDKKQDDNKTESNERLNELIKYNYQQTKDSGTN